MENKRQTSTCLVMVFCSSYLLSLQLWEEKLHSGGLANVIQIFFPPLLCDLIQGLH